MILAGDIGGTKTVLALVDVSPTGALLPIKEASYPSQHYTSFDAILDDFLPPDITLTAACFGVAGPVIEQRCQTTNLPWVLDAQVLKIRLQIPKVKLLNDLEAMALGMFQLADDELLELNPHAVVQGGNIAVIAAGTGLGEVIGHRDGTRYHIIPSEGGHSDFAPQNNLQDELLRYLRAIYPEHVSYERILAGSGFGHLYDFLTAQSSALKSSAVPDVSDAADRNAVISSLGLAGSDAVCVAALQLFVDIYGAEAGNLALKAFATGGVYIGGGIATKILPALQDGRFMQAFAAKGRFQTVLESVSVKVSINPRTPLLGALHYFGTDDDYH